MTDAGILKDILNFGSFGLVAWLFFHTYSKLIPSLHDRLDKLVDRFEKALDQQHAECTEILQRQEQKFDEMLAEYRRYAREELVAVTQAFERATKSESKEKTA